MCESCVSIVSIAYQVRDKLWFNLFKGNIKRFALQLDFSLTGKGLGKQVRN